MKPIKIILDTDIGGDCDDAGAIALLNIFSNQQEAEILAMTHTTSSKQGPALIDIINTYYKNPNIPIGAYSKKGFMDGPLYNRYASKMFEKFPSKLQLRDKVIDATKLLRKTLANLENEKCKLVCIGQLNNLANLFKSSPDEYSSLTGLELVKQNVEEICLMAGLFLEDGESIMYGDHLYETEYNIISDLTSAQFAIKNLPVLTTFIDFKVGYQILTFGPLLKLGNLNHPVAFAYYHFSNKARESWDPLTVYYAVKGNGDLLSYSPNGRVVVDELGQTTFHENSNDLHRFIKLNVAPEKMAEVIDDIVMNGERRLNNEK